MIPIITGNVASGKSTLADIMEKKGFVIISFDAEALRATMRNQKKISKALNIPSCEFDKFKSLLVTKLQNDKNSQSIFEKIIFNEIEENIKLRIEDMEYNKMLYVVEMPTFFEIRGLQKHENYFIIMVDAADKDRIRRIMLRNNLTFDEAYKRLGTQIKASEKYEFADIVLINNDFKEFKEKCKEFANSLLKKR